MVRSTGRSALAAVFATLLVATSCDDSREIAPEAWLGLPDLATLAVTVSTSGSDIPGGYTVTVDGSTSQSVGANAIATFLGLSIGDHQVALQGVPANCSVAGDNPRTVSLIAGVVGATSFSVSCSQQPTTGDLTVSTNTTGSDLDADGYTVTVDGNTSKSIGINGSVTFSGLPAGDHSVQLSGVAANCSASGGNPRTVSVPAGGTGSTTFAVSCAATGPTTGNLTVSTSTTGSNLDPDGYAITVDGGASQAIGDNASVTFSGLSAGNHTVTIAGVASNCSVSGGTSRTVSVTAGATASTSFSVSCAPTGPTTGNLTVNTSTTGSDLDPDGYAITVDGGASQAAATNGSVTFTGLAAGSHTVVISGVAANCSVSGGSSQTVSVPAGGTATTTFSVSCAATGGGNGSLTVNTSTTGSNLDPDGYTVTIDGQFSQPIATNGSVTFTGPAGDHTLQLSGAAANCAIAGPNPRTVTVPSGGTATTTFSVSCTGGGGGGSGEVIGNGQIGSGSPTPGSDATTFDFDIRSDLTGRFSGTDWADLHGSTPATLTTDPVADPATSFTAYRNSSSACSDPSRGVEVDAVGREDTGTLVNYTMTVCDNGPAGSGMDFFKVFIPSEQFGVAGQVTSGDISKQ